MYLIQHYVIKFVSDLPHMMGVLDTALCYKVVSDLPHDGVYLIQHYVIKFVSDLTHDKVYLIQHCYNSLSVTCHMTGCT